MKLRTSFAIFAARLAKLFLKIFKKGGTSYPGQLALKIDPDVLTQLTKDKKVIIVSGTNGKTLTTAMITTILKQKYDVITNESGSNMMQGITTTLIDARKSNREQVAVLEVDEANIRKMTPYIDVDFAVFTNVFRDQMDRFGEIYTTYRLMCEGVKINPKTKVVLNGDLSLFNTGSLENSKIFYGFQHEEAEEVVPHYNSDGLLCPKCHSLLKYHLVTYSNLGHYHCPKCGFKRPNLTYSITELTQLKQDSSSFKVNDFPYQIEIGGLYNIYNALAAISVCRELGLSEKEVQQGLTLLERKFGRQEIFHYKGKRIVINLIKNPVGFDQIVELLALDEEPKTIIGILNDNHADGKDVSWIWDGDFEKLMQQQISEVSVDGIRKDELQLRFEVAGAENVKELNGFEDILKTIETATTKNVYILPTYTALLDLRAQLAKENLVGKELK